MMDSNDTPSPISSRKRPGRPLRVTAAIVLLLGIFGADAVYYSGTHSAQTKDDPALLGNEKAQMRQEEILYGQQSVLIDNWTNDLKRPGTQAVIVLTASILVAGGCFYFSRLLDRSDDHS